MSTNNIRFYKVRKILCIDLSLKCTCIKRIFYFKFSSYFEKTVAHSVVNLGRIRYVFTF